MSKSPMLGIECTPGVCGGDACIARTRIPVWVLVRARQLGKSHEELLEDYPTLSRHDLDNAWAYYDLHQADIERLIECNESLDPSSQDCRRMRHEERDPPTPSILR